MVLSHISPRLGTGHGQDMKIQVLSHSCPIKCLPGHGNRAWTNTGQIQDRFGTKSRQIQDRIKTELRQILDRFQTDSGFECWQTLYRT